MILQAPFSVLFKSNKSLYVDVRKIDQTTKAHVQYGQDEEVVENSKLRYEDAQGFESSKEEEAIGGGFYYFVYMALPSEATV